jgi:SAM-dependent methyltransferase
MSLEGVKVPAPMPMVSPLRAPEPDSAFRRFHGRLALFKRQQRVENYWRDYWQRPGKNEQLHSGVAEGDLGEYAAPFLEHLVPGGKVLEAGCGPAQFVRALRHHGFDASGVDYDADVVAWVRENAPGVPIVQGDVRKLDLESGSLDGYVSLGVVEHFEEGPEDILREARRVLAPHGKALVSVPYLNPARARELRQQAEGKDVPAGQTFYQYYLDDDDFRACAKRAGLEVIATYPLFAAQHLSRDHGLLSRYWNSRLHPTRIRPLTRLLLSQVAKAPKPIRTRYAHMMMFICKPA